MAGITFLGKPEGEISGLGPMLARLEAHVALLAYMPPSTLGESVAVGRSVAENAARETNNLSYILYLVIDRAAAAAS